MARRHGSKGQVKMDPTGGATTVAIGALNSWTLSLERDKADVTCFGDTTKQYVLGLPDISGELNGVWDEALSPGTDPGGAGRSPRHARTHPVDARRPPTCSRAWRICRPASNARPTAP